MKQNISNPANGLRALVDAALSTAAAAKNKAAPGTVLGNRTSLSGISAPANTITYDAPAYTPSTTGSAIILVTLDGVVSSAGDTCGVQPRANLASVGNPANTPSGTGTTCAGMAYAVVPITAGVAITPGVFAFNGAGGHTVTVAAGGLQVTIIELQTH